MIVEGAIDMVKRHSFEPSFYYRPDHVEIQLSYLAYMAYAQSFPQHFEIWPACSAAQEVAPWKTSGLSSPPPTPRASSPTQTATTRGDILRRGFFAPGGLFAGAALGDTRFTGSVFTYEGLALTGGSSIGL